MKKRFAVLTALTALFALLGGQPLFAAALSASTAYQVTISKVKSDGALEDLETSSATTDANGKLAFNLTSIPTNDTCNFVVVTIKTSANVVVKRAIVPAPPANDKNLVGINDMSEAQAATLLKMLSVAQSDDPILTSYGIVLLRSPQVTDNDATILGNLGKKAIIASGSSTTPSFEEFLSGSAFGNISSAKITRFKQCLVYNNFSTNAGRAKTIRDFSRGFYDANEKSSASDATKEMQKAGGLMADIFMDAGLCAGIPAGKILAAHDATGDVANSIVAASTMSQAVKMSMEQSMTAFYKRIAMTRVAAEYTKALAALNATGTQVNNFMAAVSKMSQATAAIDSQFAGFYNDPAGFLAANSGTYTDAAAVRSAMDTLYQAAFTQFRSDIKSSDAEIATMKAKIQQAFPGVPLPTDFGTYHDFDTNSTINWPIPQTVMVTWLADQLLAGGTFSYTRDTTTVPSFAIWMGTCKDGGGNPLNYYDQNSCQSNGGTWTVGRHDYSFVPAQAAAFKYYLQLQEDVQIIEMNRWALWQLNTPDQITKAMEREYKTTFENRMAALKGHLSGTKNSAGTAITDAEKAAIIKMLMQPSEE